MRNLTTTIAATLLWAGAVSRVPVPAQTVIKGSDIVINGESFFAASNIGAELTRLARADGILAPNDNIKQIAVSGASNVSVVNFYKNCNPKPTFLISDAGVDLMTDGNCTDENCPVIQNVKRTMLAYLDEMRKSGTKKLLWQIYPIPQGTGWAVLKKNQEIWSKIVPDLMASVTEPKVLVVDLRPVWEGHYSQYTADGIHCTAAGGTATAEAFWKAMKANDFFDLNPPTTLAMPAAKPAFLDPIVSGKDLLLSLSLSQPATDVTMRLVTVSGRPVLSAASREGAGRRMVRFPLGSVAPGVYCLTVRAGQATKQSALRIP